MAQRYDEESGEWYDDGSEDHLSPWEQAHGGHEYDPNSSDNAQNDFDREVADYYDGGPVDQGVNWYQPESYSQPQGDSGGGGGGSDSGGGGRSYTAEEAEWLSRNPGDEHRMAEALRSDNFGGGGNSRGSMPTFPGFTFNFPQPNTAYSEMVMRLMQQQEARMAEDAARRRSFEDQLRTSLMDLIRRGQEPIDANAISQSQEAKAFARVRERQLQKYRAKMAEQRGAQGLGQNFSGEVGGAFGSDIQGGESQLREQIAAFESKMVADQINRRRQELMQALSMGAGMLNSEQSNAIRSELAQLDAALQREQFHADLGLREFLGGGQLSLGMLGAMNQNQQFYDRLGYDYDTSQSDLMYRILYGG